MAAEEKKPGKVKRFFRAIFNFPKKILKLSLPAHAAILTTIFLITVVIWVWVALASDSNTIAWEPFSFWRIVIEIILVIIIPIVVYRGLKLWLQGDTSQFADIDFAWKTGLAALKRNGISIDETPVFVVLGSTDEAQEKSLMRASQVSTRVTCVPEGPSPLHWYANPDGIYLFCTQASWLSTLVSHSTKQSLGDFVSSKEDEIVFDQNLNQPQDVAPDDAPAIAPPSPAPQAAAGGEVGHGTIMLDQFVDVSTPAAAATPTADSSGDTRGTMMLQQPVQISAAQQSGVNEPVGQLPQSNPRASSTYAISESSLLTLPPQDTTEQLQRLHYVCQLLKKARQPLCGINGIITLLPFETLQIGAAESAELKRAVSGDLTTIQRELQLRCPTTALIVGMERERGFRELVRRVGYQRALAQRFGRRFDIRSLPTMQELASLCVHVCGAFEDWVYTLFREKQALTRPGNTRLYSLLCKVRIRLKDRLTHLLEGFSTNSDPNDLQTEDDPIAFSGCYFAATGNDQDRQAFVKGVFDKLLEEQENVEWTSSALKADRRLVGFALTGIILSGALLITLGVMITKSLF